jgi:hypothetical protein
MTFYINQLALVFFNLLNSHIDAYRILRHKSIAHFVNFSLYAAFVGLIVFLFKMSDWEIFLFVCSAFFNRQITFDVPLNLRRGLAWDYQSIADPPKAIMDRIENIIFAGTPGSSIVMIYLEAWIFVVSAYNLTFL